MSSRLPFLFIFTSLRIRDLRIQGGPEEQSVIHEEIMQEKAIDLPHNFKENLEF